MPERLQKILSERGIASRRAAEKLIGEGRVKVNGRTAVLGQSADPAVDRIEVSGKRLPFAPSKRYIMLNKPRGYVTTVSDELSRKTVMDLLQGIPARVYPVGRLDRDSEGLLILTNDGEFANKMMHPVHGVSKVYHVSVSGDLEKGLSVLRGKMVVDGYRLEPAEVFILRETEAGVMLSVTIREGRNRQIRKMCEQAGLEVRRLKRVAVGGVELSDLPSGKWRDLTAEELVLLTGGKT